jgi:dephospho-CoA kinase
MIKHVYVTGAPGTGKSAISRELNNKSIPSFDIDEVEGLCHWTNKETGTRSLDYIPTQEWLEAHDWICDVEKLKEILSLHKDTVVVTGIAGNQDEFLSLFSEILVLQCTEEAILSRLKQRQKEDGNRFGEHQTERNYVTKMFQTFNDDLIIKGAIPIDANKSINFVVGTILTRLESSK